MMPTPHVLTVVAPYESTDRYRNAVLSYAVPPAISRTVPGFVQPAVTSESTIDRAATRAEYVVYTLGRIEANERVVWQGQTFEVKGPPRQYDTPSGTHHYETSIQSIEG